MPAANANLAAPAVVLNGVAIASDPSVVRVNGEYLMFYTDLNYEGVATAISVARSPDGVTWTRVMAPGDPGGSVLGGTHSYETAEAVMINGELFLYVAEYDEFWRADWELRYTSTGSTRISRLNACHLIL